MWKTLLGVNENNYKKKKKKENLPTNHKVKLNENEKRDKYIYLARELENCGT